MITCQEDIILEGVVQNPATGEILITAIDKDNEVHSWEYNKSQNYDKFGWEKLEGYPSKNFERDFNEYKTSIAVDEAQDFIIAKADRNFEKMLDIMKGWDNLIVSFILKSFVNNLIFETAMIFDFNKGDDKHKLYKRVQREEESRNLLRLLNVFFENYKS